MSMTHATFKLSCLVERWLLEGSSSFQFPQLLAYYHYYYYYCYCYYVFIHLF